MMDDANVPSLLSIPYLGYKSKHDPDGQIYKNTRQFILSSNNPWYFSSLSPSFKGIGSPHTGPGRVWPMSLIMQALTSNDENEIAELIRQLKESDAGTNFMHESFSVSNPHQFTRTWFAWANSLFSELVIKHKELIKARQL
jgi:uncharacterized protein